MNHFFTPEHQSSRNLKRPLQVIIACNFRRIIMSTPLSRRDFLKATAGAIGALGVSLKTTRIYGKGIDNHLRIGYLPITDATPLLIAHARGYFQ